MSFHLAEREKWPNLKVQRRRKAKKTKGYMNDICCQVTVKQYQSGFFCMNWLPRLPRDWLSSLDNALNGPLMRPIKSF